MSPKSPRPTARERLACAGFCALVGLDVILLLFTAIKLLFLQDYSSIFPHPRADSIVPFLLAVLLIGITAISLRRRMFALMWLVALAFLPLGCGYPISYLHTWIVWAHRNPRWSTEALAALRKLTTREEDYRLLHGAYCSDTTCLGWNLPGSMIAVRTEGALAWSAVAQLANGARCSVSVGGMDSASRAPEGVPVCQEGNWSSYLVHNEIRKHARPSSHLEVASWHPTVDTNATWLQYRGDSARSGTVSSASGRISASWRAAIAGEVRSTVSAASGLILVGTHDNGELEARSARSGALAWRTRVPNWIHSEAVIAHGEAVVGFGSAADVVSDNPSLQPTSQNGIAAFSLADGRRLWQVASRGSVMTSPVIVGSLVIFATGFNEAMAVNLATGALVWTRTLPGGAVMGSPAASGKDVYFSLEPNRVCRAEAETGRLSWCRELGIRYVLAGHAAPAVEHDVVYVSAIERPQILLERFPHMLPAVAKFLYYRATGNPAADLVRERGQTLFALSARTGERIWKTAFDGRKPFVGHPAGAPVATPTGIAIVLPTSHTVAMVSRSTGAVIWRANTGSQARGPITAAHGRLILSTPEGEVRILDESSGRTVCEYPLPPGSDRAGPTIYDGTVYFALLDGALVATPLDRVLACTP